MAEAKAPPRSGVSMRPPRADMETKVSLEFDKFSGFLQEYSANISEGGMFIRTATPKRVGTVFNFEFKLKDHTPLLSGWGEVRWIREKEEGPDRPQGMGIKFVDLDLSSRDLITRIVRQRGVEGLAAAMKAPLEVPPAKIAREERTLQDNDNKHHRQPPSEPAPPQAASAPDFAIEELSLEADAQAEAFAQDVLQLSNEGDQESAPPQNDGARSLMKDLFGGEATAPSPQAMAEKTEVIEETASPSSLHDLMSELNPSAEAEKPAASFPPPSLTAPEATAEPAPPQAEEVPTPATSSRRYAWIVLLLCLAVCLGLGYYWRDRLWENYLMIRTFSFSGPATPTFHPRALPGGQMATPVPVRQVSISPPEVRVPHVISPLQSKGPASKPLPPTTTTIAVKPAAPAISTSQMPLPSAPLPPEPEKSSAVHVPTKATARATARADRLLHIVVKTKGRETAILLEGNGALDKDRVAISAITRPSQRLLLKVSGIHTGYKPQKTKVTNSPYLNAIRTGHHADNTLHIVLDLKGTRLPRPKLSQQGQNLLLLLSFRDGGWKRG